MGKGYRQFLVEYDITDEYNPYEQYVTAKRASRVVEYPSIDKAYDDSRYEIAELCGVDVSKVTIMSVVELGLVR